MTSKRILLVDDEPVVREYGEQALAECGYDVVTAEDGKQALEFLLYQRFDAAVIDLKLPGFDGRELLQRIRAQGISLPVWIMTGYGSFDTCMECAQLGIQGYLPKPFSMTALAHLIEETLTAAFEPIRPRTLSPSFRSASLEDPFPEGRQPLTPREKEVLWYIRHGLTDAEIAQALFVSNHTVHNHVKHIVEKLGVKNRVEAVSLSYQSDLF